MIITRSGVHFIKLQAGDTVVALNPPSKDSKEKSARFGADVAFVSLNHEDFNGADTVQFGDKVPFVVVGPGEYEIKGIFAKGFASKSKYDLKGKEENKQNTVYFLTMDNMSLCFLGASSDPKLSDEALEAVDEIDILFVPVSNKTLSPNDAYKLAVSLEAKIIIPLGEDADVKAFAKEAGGEKMEVLEKLTLKKKDLEGKEGEVVFLKL
jgi:L-ascorbate metabolism protein UlaG (beta-lactamase superfamily)